MSRVPMLSDKASLYVDPAVAKQARFVIMGLAADLIASLEGISREECDAYAVRSQQRAAAAQASGAFANSLIPINGAAQDECVRGSVTAEKLATFDPLFTEFGKQGYEAAFKKTFSDLDEFRYVHHARQLSGHR